jgi:hypothetical protein
MRLSLDADPTDYLAFGSTGLIFQEEIKFEECEAGEDGEVSLTEVEEDYNLENGV